MKYITKAGCNFEIDYDANLSRYTAKPENKTPYYRNFTTQLCLSIPELLIAPREGCYLCRAAGTKITAQLKGRKVFLQGSTIPDGKWITLEFIREIS